MKTYQAFSDSSLWCSFHLTDFFFQFQEFCSGDQTNLISMSEISKFNNLSSTRMLPFFLIYSITMSKDSSNSQKMDLSSFFLTQLSIRERSEERSRRDFKRLRKNIDIESALFQEIEFLPPFFITRKQSFQNLLSLWLSNPPTYVYFAFITNLELYYSETNFYRLL